MVIVFVRKQHVGKSDGDVSLSLGDSSVDVVLKLLPNISLNHDTPVIPLVLAVYVYIIFL